MSEQNITSEITSLVSVTKMQYSRKNSHLPISSSNGFASRYSAFIYLITKVNNHKVT